VNHLTWVSGDSHSPDLLVYKGILLRDVLRMPSAPTASSLPASAQAPLDSQAVQPTPVGCPGVGCPAHTDTFSSLHATVTIAAGIADVEQMPEVRMDSNAPIASFSTGSVAPASNDPYCPANMNSSESVNGSRAAQGFQPLTPMMRPIESSVTNARSAAFTRRLGLQAVGNSSFEEAPKLFPQLPGVGEENGAGVRQGSKGQGSEHPAQAAGIPMEHQDEETDHGDVPVLDEPEGMGYNRSRRMELEWELQEQGEHGGNPQRLYSLYPSLDPSNWMTR
jgi:hypothetical protein